MSVLKTFDETELSVVGEGLYEFAAELYPICRSITGDGIRRTLSMIGERIPLKIHEVPSGTQVFDWTVPNEWNIQDAYIVCPDGTRLADFKKSNLHVLNYSAPIRARMPLSKLRPHLYQSSQT